MTRREGGEGRERGEGREGKQCGWRMEGTILRSVIVILEIVEF